MSDVFDEVEENLRADKVNRLWKTTWPLLLGASIAIVGMVGFYSYQQDARAKRIETQGKQFENALKSLEIQDMETARKNLKELSNEDSGFGRLAGHYLAQAEIQFAGDTQAATEALKKAGEGNDALSRLARMKAAYFIADTGTLADVEAALGDLVDDSGAFGALAHELIAAKAYQEGQFQRARSEYQSLTLRMDTPEGVKTRAANALVVIPKPEEVAPTESDITPEVVTEEDTTTPASTQDTMNTEDPS